MILRLQSVSSSSVRCAVDYMELKQSPVVDCLNNLAVARLESACTENCLRHWPFR